MSPERKRNSTTPQCSVNYNGQKRNESLDGNCNGKGTVGARLGRIESLLKSCLCLFHFMEEFKRYFKKEQPDITSAAAICKAAGDKWR